MKLLNIKKVDNHDKVRLIGVVQTSNFDQPIELYFEYSSQFKTLVDQGADAFVPALLLPAMAKGEALEIELPISEKLFQKLNTIQDIYCQWYPTYLKKINVFANNYYHQNEHQKSHYVGAFFSLGVDSFYTLLKDLSSENSQISHLIYMKGLEKPLHIYKQAQELEVISRIEEVANQVGKTLIVGESNIRDHFSLNWEKYYVGAGLASAALSLSSGLESVLIPSTHAYIDLVPQASNILTDPLWSTEKTTIIHDGSELERAEKTAYFIAKDPLAMKYLRVCTKNSGGKNNCGRCGKCIRTMIALHIAKSLPQAETLPKELPKDFEKMIVINDKSELILAEENFKLAQKMQAEESLIKSLERIARTAEVELFLKENTLIKSKIFFKVLLNKLINKIMNN